MVTKSANERDAMIGSGEVRQEDVLEAPRSPGRQPTEAIPLYDLTLRLEDRPEDRHGDRSLDSWTLGKVGS